MWDYPIPPRIEKIQDHIRVIFGGETIAESYRASRILETSHPPVYYLPPDDVRLEFLVPVSGKSFCEFKGVARYWSLNVNGKRSDRAAWSYPAPAPDFAGIINCLAFYPSRVDECWVGEERALPQPGDFYGGWITSRSVGPFTRLRGSLLRKMGTPSARHGAKADIA